MCFRKEFALEFLADAIRRFREQFPRVGFLLVGPWDREMDGMKTFVKDQNIEDGVCLLASVPHETFLTLLSRSLAYIRTPSYGRNLFFGVGVAQTEGAGARGGQWHSAGRNTTVEGRGY